jgi:hypothetical protein
MDVASSLPPLYAGWIDALLGAPIPAETNATCRDCAMLVPPPERASDDAGYDPATKCCTYLPVLWNFLVGGVLLDDTAVSARGRASVEARLDAGVAATPLGLQAPPVSRLLYKMAPGAFGHSKAMRCPHYLDAEGGLCGVWRHRESTCATWFCKHARGATGKEFWSQLHQLLVTAEQAVSAWCLLELGLDEGALDRLYRPYRVQRPRAVTGRDVDGEPDPADVRAAWGTWRGRERELYRECARLVATLEWADVAHMGGSEIDVYARLTRRAYDRLVSDDVPEHVETALVQITPRANNRARLATYSDTDALDVPATVAAILPYFDGRSTADVLEEIRSRDRLRIDPSLVRKLTDFGVLRAVTDSTSA